MSTRYEGARAEVVNLQAEVAELMAFNERVASTDEVAKAYQQVYFEDTRCWKAERFGRIMAEVEVKQLRDALTEALPWLQGVDIEREPQRYVESYNELMDRVNELLADSAETETP